MRETSKIFGTHRDRRRLECRSAGFWRRLRIPDRVTVLGVGGAVLLARLDFLPWPRRRHASCPYPEVVVDMTRLKFLSATLLATPGALMSAGCTHEDSAMPPAADGATAARFCAVSSRISIREYLPTR